MLDGNDGDKYGGRHPCLQNSGGIFHVTQAEGNRHNSGNSRCHQKPQTGGTTFKKMAASSNSIYIVLKMIYAAHNGKKDVAVSSENGHVASGR